MIPNKTTQKRCKHGMLKYEAKARPELNERAREKAQASSITEHNATPTSIKCKENRRAPVHELSLAETRGSKRVWTRKGESQRIQYYS